MFYFWDLKRMIFFEFQECMPPSSTISLLCLEDTPSRSQRCFAVYHNNVIIYNLLNGSCVGHLKELHPREITAVLFFNPLKVQCPCIRKQHCEGIAWDSTPLLVTHPPPECFFFRLYPKEMFLCCPF